MCAEVVQYHHSGLWWWPLDKKETFSSLPLVGLVGDFVFVFWGVWGVVFCLSSVFGMLDDVPSSGMLFCV